ncbi:MAG: RtcB family protein [Clostridia bacterium]|nr:RtcB family protein [Clostridia bacterium]
MLTVTGKYNTAKVFTDIIEESAIAQLKELCNQSFVEGCKIRIMPDVHTGSSCVIGFTADLGKKVIPNIVGVDIGCGMLTVNLGKEPIDFDKLDRIIIREIPSGKEMHKLCPAHFGELENLHCYKNLKLGNIEKGLGTLGGGNHFIEVDEDDEGNKYLVIHSGSRNLGKQVAEYYQETAVELHRGFEEYEAEKKRVIAEYRATGKGAEIEPVLKKMKKEFAEKEPDIPAPLCYLEGKYRDMYLHDMNICQHYASFSRYLMAKTIVNGLFEKEIEDFDCFETVHNYIDMESNIIRKGAVSAKKDEMLLIPINMRDGSLICIGKGNDDWNCSAPHGAGRLYSRSRAKEELSMEDYKKSMDGIYTSSVSSDTLDECPQAYKPIESILENIVPTVEVVKIIRPVYNFKAGNSEEKIRKLTV